jgi:P27 family predicted phage terminase small subunit
MRGRKPKSAAEQMAAGDPRKRGARKLAERADSEPKATKGLPPCPKHLRGRARAAWNFWAEELFAMGIDRRPDAMMLEGACVNYARAVQADLILEKEGPVVTESIIDKQGEVIPLKVKAHPAVSVSRGAWMLMGRFCTEFGLSPVSASRISVDRKNADEDELLRLLSAPRPPRVVPESVQ